MEEVILGAFWNEVDRVGDSVWDVDADLSGTVGKCLQQKGEL